MTSESDLDVNPFDDSAIRQHDDTKVAGLSNYNPFEENVDLDDKDDPEDLGHYEPPLTTIDNPFVTDKMAEIDQKPKTLDERKLEVEQRHRELDERERMLDKRVKNLGDNYNRPHNWPKCYPFLHHNISSDIPKENRTMIRLAYWAWIWGVIGTSWNFICVFAKLGVDNAKHKGNDVGLGIAYFLFSPPLSWIFWYRLLYNAARKNKSFKFLTFFCTFFFWMLLAAVFVVGVDGTGCAGIVNTVNVFDCKSQSVGILFVVNILVWFFQLLFDVFLFKMVHSFYRSSGGSVEKAKKEVAQETTSIAVDFQKEAVKSQLK
ncbi:secretory carrier-associated membrane protein [Anaeramoeba ignava]|uniref:Secretory carrier-associated membrane protein n=1 Tax=Anaeramoeba ignava TaxID=1746090 RepID=A0A9Q0L7J1_ANAIG|nr:secretory carrier-associated membrane protein [Anaeramoeba ignava]|eukprot:Anaeramoba_ignava/a2966_111.p1 GENE.a2966_111~~a2966_111.p1  ORF type:complete len:318 (-),score=93.15 a2966_111:129-1082(-)